jgi:hypothetical protein
MDRLMTDYWFYYEALHGVLIQTCPNDDVLEKVITSGTSCKDLETLRATMNQAAKIVVNSTYPVATRAYLLRIIRAIQKLETERILNSHFTYPKGVILH